MATPEHGEREPQPYERSTNCNGYNDGRKGAEKYAGDKGHHARYRYCQKAQPYERKTLGPLQLRLIRLMMPQKTVGRGRYQEDRRYGAAQQGCLIYISLQGSYGRELWVKRQYEQEPKQHLHPG